MSGEAHEADFERAERLAREQVDAAVREAADALSRTGTAVCQDCDREISAERRAVAPFAVRCLPCQWLAERKVA
jgi:RNA polymerase-binding transcription factor DksA